MRFRLWCLAAVLPTLTGCASQYNPNEKDFPGAPGSSVPAPKADTSAKPKMSMGRGDDANLPSSYPGIGKFRESFKKSEEAGKAGAEAKETPKDAPKDAPKPDTPKDAPKPDTPKDAPKPDTPKDTPKPDAPK